VRRGLDQQAGEEVTGFGFEAAVVDVLRGVIRVLEEVRDELPWPASEHVGYRVSDASEALRGLESAFTQNRKGN
jgi:hypothetical protein